MKIFAHRGYSSKHIENTKKAFEACKKLNIYGIELDVQYSKDKKVIIFHDENIQRLTGVDKFLKDLTYQELTKYSFEDGQTFLSLEEYLDIVEDSPLVTNVELKTSKFEYLGIEQDVYDSFLKRNMLDRLLISSFNHKSLVRFKEIDSKIPLAALFTKPKTLNEKFLEEHDIKIYHPNHFYLRLKDIKKYHEKGITVNVWTVNDKFNFIKSKLFGVDGIITNYPEI